MVYTCRSQYRFIKHHLPRLREAVQHQRKRYSYVSIQHARKRYAFQIILEKLLDINDILFHEIESTVLFEGGHFLYCKTVIHLA